MVFYLFWSQSLDVKVFFLGIFLVTGLLIIICSHSSENTLI